MGIDNAIRARSDRPHDDTRSPGSGVAVVFPGQGSSSPTMRQDVAQVRPDLLEAVIGAMGTDPFELAERDTRHAQPAIFCASLAGFERWRGQTSRAPAFLAGHSLGELSALVAGGAIDSDSGLRLVIERARLMDEACERTDGGMVAVLGRDARRGIATALELGLAVANDNAPEQVIVAGKRPDLERFETWAEEAGVTTRRLPVAGAFHSAAMATAVDGFRRAVARVTFRTPRIPVFSCVTARPFDDVPGLLVQALLAPVRWQETVLAMRAAGAHQFVETGPGEVLTGLIKRILRGQDAPRRRELAHG